MGSPAGIRCHTGGTESHREYGRDRLKALPHGRGSVWDESVTWVVATY